ncbi:MAG: histidinol-phosphate transaminase [Thermodesulfobacteriota bacterium]|nr:histidinol-phosphate transaminase [Thermodesulfobacteriota bacterium]
MNKYWSNFVNTLSPYTPGEQPKDKGLIKLNTNENPYPPSPRVIQALNMISKENLKLYPDPTAKILKEEIANYYDVDQSSVFVGNGSDEILAFSFLTFFKKSKPILFPDLTYSFYPVYCNLFGIDSILIPVTDDLSIQLTDYYQENGGIILANPNSPTGRCLSTDLLEELMKDNTQTVVIVDEAYIDFGGESAIPLTRTYPNLLIIQTLSKSRSLAGLRVGFAIGNKELIVGLEKVKNSFNSYPIDSLALVGAVEAIKDKDYFEKTRKDIIETRKWLCGRLENMSFIVIPSQANFLFVRHPSVPAIELYGSLKKMGILVRHFNTARTENYLRISVGTRQEVEALEKALISLLSQRGA